MKPTSRRTVLFAAAALVAAGACSDSGGEPALSQYCEMSRQLNEQDGPPSREQFDALLAITPAEITDDTRRFGEAVLAEGPAAFDDPAVVEAEERLVAFDDLHCGAGADGT